MIKIQKEVYDKLSQLDKIEYILEKEVVCDTSEFARTQEFIIIIGFISMVGLTILERLSTAVVVLSLALIFYLIVTILKIIVSHVNDKNLDKKYTKRVKINNKAKNKQ